MEIVIKTPRRYAMFPKGYAAKEATKEEAEALASDIEGYIYKRGFTIDKIKVVSSEEREKYH
jgi:hypothetical protein